VGERFELVWAHCRRNALVVDAVAPSSQDEVDGRGEPPSTGDRRGLLDMLFGTSERVAFEPLFFQFAHGVGERPDHQQPGARSGAH